MKSYKEKSGVDLIEEAGHLLRSLPVGTFAYYYVGSAPFILGFLYFFTELSHYGNTKAYISESAFGLAALFIWMKLFQTIFTIQLKSTLFSRASMPMTFDRLFHIAVIQTIIQPSGLFIMPIAFLLTIPFPWAYAFYQNVAILGDGVERDTKTIYRKAYRQAALWSGQNIIILLILFLFGLFVFFNLAIMFLWTPSLLKSLFGIETPFNRNIWSMMNTTFFLTALSFAYLCVDPLVKAIYVLRCFYGESLQSGEDLKAELSRFLSAKNVLALALAVALNFGTVVDAQTVDSPVTSQRLDQSIEEVLQQGEYAWRYPRQKEEQSEAENLVIAFFKGAIDTLNKWFKTLSRWLQDAKDWITDKLSPYKPSVPAETKRDGFSVGWTYILLWILIIAVASILGVLLWRIWKNREKRPIVAFARPAVPAPDLNDETLTADELPEDQWRALAMDLLTKGDLRLAVRAFYLSTLAFLGQKEFIAVAKYKSNNDYKSELRRRAHNKPDILPLFSQIALRFERVWYGMHEASLDMVRQLIDYDERMKTIA
jgi:hypothetical protein